MYADQEAMMLVRADLCERLEAIQRLSKRRTGDVAGSVIAIRQIAGAYGLMPVVRLAEAAERAMQETPNGWPMRLYLDRLHDAIGCRRTDDQASEAMLASVSVRFGA